MKLVDILARKMKSWPEGSESLSQTYQGHVYFNAGTSVAMLSYLTAEDYETAKVTRAEWQSAVDSLSAPQNYESQNVARIEWDGEGLPPIGVACQVTPHNDVWGFSTLETRPCSVIAYHADFAWIDLGTPGVPVATRIDKVDFTPIRTPDQIAEAERQAFIDQVIDDSMGRCDIPGAAYLYEAGYRKP